jgi:hypothetical protein
VWDRWDRCSTRRPEQEEPGRACPRNPEQQRELHKEPPARHSFEQRVEMVQHGEEVSRARLARKLQRRSTRQKGLPKVVTWMALLGLGLLAMHCGLYLSASTGAEPGDPAAVSPPPRRCYRPLRAYLTCSTHTLRGSPSIRRTPLTHISASMLRGLNASTEPGNW